MTSPHHTADDVLPLRGAIALGAALAIIAAVPIAGVIALVHRAMPDNPEGAVALTVILFGALAALAPALVVLRLRRATRAVDVGLALLVAAGVLLIASYLYAASSAIFLRADTIIWAEGLFVGDILKVRAGYPLFTDPRNLESTFYPPGASMLSYALASLVGQGTSVPALRIVQLLFAGIASIVGAVTAARLLSMARPSAALNRPMAWGAAWGTMLFLAATNTLTNPFGHLLHNDALSVLVSVVAFWLLTEYAARRNVRFLVALACVPAAGFYVKQSLVAWAALVTAYLILFDQPRSFRRVLRYGFASFGIAVAAFGVGYLAWGHDFYFWTIVDLKGHPFSPLRSVEHAVAGWAYFAAGVVGALALFGTEWRRVAGLWAVALVFLAQEAWTSGIAWMMNHMGPGSMLAAIWFAGALTTVWRWLHEDRAEPALAWGRTMLVTALVLLSYSGLGLIRIPVPETPTDVNRYVAAIERETAGMDLRKVLLDHGSWIYLDTGVIPRDRSALVGDLGYSGQGDYSGMLGRIRSRSYSRILMRDYDSPEFFYDHAIWPASSGIRDALEANYRPVRKIEAVTGHGDGMPYFRTITVLEPLR